MNRSKIIITIRSTLGIIGLLVIVLLQSSCNKVDYTHMEAPAYLRVFNNLNYKPSMHIKDGKTPFFCMLINPDVDASGKPRSAEIVGDFLDVRNDYAPPYPSHIGTSSTMNNPEFPGKDNILVGPVLNGFDLSSWAQVPSGKVRIMFLYRPKNTVKYFDLDEQLQGDVIIDTTLNLESTEVYTLHLLQKHFLNRTNTVILRQENFHKLTLSDSLVYVNFYNYSSEGFSTADNSLKDEFATFRYGLKDRTNVYISLYADETNIGTYQTTGIPGYVGKFMTSMERNSGSSAPAPYQSFPIWVNPKDDGIRTKLWQKIDFFASGIFPVNNPHANNRNQDWEAVGFLSNRNIQIRPLSGTLPNMLVNIHSGNHNPKTYATVNTVEVVNGYVYLTTIQRKYQPPIY